MDPQDKLPFRGSVKTMNKPECIRLCDALDISNKGLVKDLKSHLEVHLKEHSAMLTGNPQFAQLYYSGKGSGKPRKVTEDKAKEDVEADTHQETAITLKKLVAQGIPKDPPSKSLPLSIATLQTQYRQRQEETRITSEDESNESSQEQNEEHDELDSSSLPASEHSLVREENHEVNNMMERASLTPSLASVPDILMVSLRDYSNRTGPPVFQGHISTDKVPMIVHDDDSTGRRIRRVKLSHVLPALIDQHTPVKKPGSRFYTIPPRSQMTAPLHLGAVDKIEQGLLQNLPSLLDNYEAAELKDLPGAFEVQLLWDRPNTAEAIAGPSGAGTRPGPGPGPVAAGPPPSKLASNIPKSNILTDTNESDDEPEIVWLSADPKLIKFLRKALGIRESEWPKAHNLSIALQRYNATRKALQMLEQWGWSHSSGGYLIPKDDPRDTEKKWAGSWFDIQTAREGVFVKHAAAHEDRALFEQHEDALPTFFKWIKNPTKPSTEKFESWSLAKFKDWREKQLKQLKKEQRKGKKKKRSRKSSSSESSASESEERVVKRKKKKASSESESEEKLKRGKKKKRSTEYVSISDSESDDRGDDRGYGTRKLKFKKMKGRIEQDSDNLDDI